MPDQATIPARVEGARGVWRRDAGILAAVAVVVRLPAFVADSHLTYDDGVFGSSALLLRDGQQPFRDIFSPQGPLFLPLVWLADLAGLRTSDAPRLLPLIAGVGVTVATYAAGRRLTSRLGALVAAGLVTTSGSVLWTTGPIASDGPAMALATTAVALALAYRASPSTVRATLAGVTLGAALSIKVLVLPAAAPVGLLLLSRRRPRDLAAAVAGAVAVGLASTAPWGFGNVWDQSVAYHRDSTRIASHAGAARKVAVTLVERDSLVVALAALALVGATIGWRTVGPRADAIDASSGTTSPRASARGLPHASTSLGSSGASISPQAAVALLGVWAAAIAAFLVLEPAFWRPQLTHLVPPLALMVGLRPAPLPAIAAAVVLLAPWYVAHARPILWPHGYDRSESAAVDVLSRLPSGAEVITDEPGLAWRANQRVPGSLVDASIKRIEQEQITTGVLADAAADADVCAVLVWDNRYGDLVGLRERLTGERYEVVARYSGPRVLYERPACLAARPT
jgi:hypothetical protein